MYKITDNHHILKLTLTSSELVSPILEVYANDETSPTRARRYGSISMDSPYIFEIPHSDFNVGDILTKFRLVQEEVLLPWQTQEGVTIVVDGVEVANLNYNNSSTISGTNRVAYKTQFPEGTHDIQAFYVGNNEYNMSMTDKLHIVAKQPPVQESGGDPQNDGAYRLTFYGNTPTSTTYGKAVKLYLRLTKGGVPVNGKTVEGVFGGRSISTQITKTINGVAGLIQFDSQRLGAGKYKVGGYFTEDSKKIFSVYKTFTIAKAPSTITIDGGSYKKGGTIKFYFK